MVSSRSYIIIFALVFSSWCGALRAQTVHFSDTNLEAAVREAIGKPTGPISAGDLQPLMSFSAGGRNIADLSGLEFATNLTWLSVDMNRIRSLEVLKKMPQLTLLGIENNPLSDLGPLRTLTNLTA